MVRDSGRGILPLPRHGEGNVNSYIRGSFDTGRANVNVLTSYDVDEREGNKIEE